MRIPIALMACLLAAFTGSAEALEIAGARFDEHMLVGGQDTVLNGAGLRSILFFKAYAIGFYLPHRHAGLDDILLDHGAKRLRIVSLRDLTAEQINDVIDGGLHRNLSDAEYLPLVTRLEILRNNIEEYKAARAGAVIHLDWLPGKEGGVTRLTVNGVAKGQDIPGEDFFQALLKIWLGGRVNDPPLRERLLGKGGM